MALESAAFQHVIAAAKRYDRTVKLLSLGYPDLLVDEVTLKAAGCNLVEAKDAAAVAGWHGWKSPLYDTTEALRSIDIAPTYIDIRASRNCEQVFDLNLDQFTGYAKMGDFSHPFRQQSTLFGAFDVILDPGTLEHCFNIGQAFLNVAAMLAPGGTVIHTNPMSCLNHGFVNLCPTLYADFYGQNGFEVAYLGAIAGPVGSRVQAEIDPVKRVQLAPEVSSLVVVRAPSRWDGRARLPTQTKYLKNPELKA